jgi:hypothetical protein
MHLARLHEVNTQAAVAVVNNYFRGGQDFTRLYYFQEFKTKRLARDFVQNFNGAISRARADRLAQFVPPVTPPGREITIMPRLNTDEDMQ